MKKSFKQLFFAALFTGAIAAPQALAAEDVPVINMVLPYMSTSVEDVDMVEDAINEILIEKAGAKVNLVFLDANEIGTQVGLMLTGADECDIYWVNNGPTSWQRAGQALDMTPYIDGELGTGIREILGDVYVDSNRTADGKIYYLPANTDRSAEIALAVSTDMYTGLGYEIDDEKVWTWDEIHDLLAEAKEAYPDKYPLAGGQIGVNSHVTWDDGLDNTGIGVVEDYGNSGKVVSITECQDFIDLARTMRSWYEEELIMPDILSENDNAWNYLGTSAFSVISGGGLPNGMEAPDSYRQFLTIIENWPASNAAAGIGMLINSQTRYPDESFKVLEAFYTDEDVKRLVSFGIPDVHYVLDDLGRATYPEGVTGDTATYNLGMLNWWALPNGRCDIVADSYDVNYWNMLDEYDKQAKSSDIVGFRFDSTPVQDAYVACTNVVDQYYLAIVTGSIDTDEGLEMFSAALKAAGEDQVIEEKQRQLDEFLSNKQ